MKRDVKKIEIGWRLYSLIVFGVFALLFSGYVFAFGTEDPQVFGHSPGEIRVSLDIDGDGELDDANLQIVVNELSDVKQDVNILKSDVVVLGEDIENIGGENIVDDGFLAGGIHTEQNCLDAGGTVVDVGLSRSICKMSPITVSTSASWFSPSVISYKCASGWIQYASWSTTVSPINNYIGVFRDRCYAEDLRHPWSNRDLESCEYMSSRGRGDEDDEYRMAYAIMTEIGCY